MSANVDKVLAALDAGLQQSDEHGYPERVDDPSLCSRCLLHDIATGGDICSGCRAYLLGDSDDDPSTRDRHGDFMQTLIDSLNRPVEAGARRATALAQTWHPRENVAHVHEYDDTLQCACGVMDIGVVPPNRWTIDYTYVGEGRRVVHYSADGRHGQYVTDDERPFEVRMYSPDGLSLRAELVNADDIVCHWVTDTGVEWVRNRHEPAAYRVSSTIEVPAWYAVTCIHCRQVWACDPQRTMDAMAMIRANGCGEQGTCAGAGGELRRDYYVDGHGDVHTRVNPHRDWQAEAYAWLRQLVNDARRRLGL